MSKDIEQNPTRISVNPKSAFDVGELDDIADDKDMSRAALLREIIGDYVDEHTDDDGEVTNPDLAKPEHPDLRDAFMTLLDVSDHPRGPRRISVDEAEDALYSTDCAKSSVRRRYLEPLREDGYIAVKCGRITVRRRTVEEVERRQETADRQADTLAKSEPTNDDDRGDGPVMDELDKEHRKLIKSRRADIDPALDVIGWACENTVWDHGNQTAVRADGGEVTNDGE
ncbi:uncharacterized protein NP_2330A [Natronomonas pharaonis DSM 2160]|uniref:Ribbon-helix-helix protein CopG domain-containing protein n=1 Tax=Natronomonas pharaonis (strain ATCC 35678 / DSM 2160 / CIP 103997 / JCM 8858 / NBRC 14720 / NCIMB 2260 / Gabara) TaxID=348780 RepID=A0A1U7EW13_NATPD|nr:hypothetical protein [Natronomonas pharaonis]CAI49256.1 uncharacterized protein NP_2330A [Natronomonas pharaonis DSM 2160]